MTEVMEDIADVLGDINFFCGADRLELLESLDEDMGPDEILYTLSELKSLVVTRLIEEGRTYEA